MVVLRSWWWWWLWGNAGGGGEGRGCEEESESSEGWLQGSSYTPYTRGVATSRCTDGWILSSSGQCPLVTLNHPAVQSGPRRLRMRPLSSLPSSSSSSSTSPPSQLPTLRSPTSLLPPRRHLYRIYTCIYIYIYIYICIHDAGLRAGTSRCFNFFHRPGHPLLSLPPSYLLYLSLSLPPFTSRYFASYISVYLLYLLATSS